MSEAVRIRGEIEAIIADAINRFKDARISGNDDVWAGVGSRSVVDAATAVMAAIDRAALDMPQKRSKLA